MTGPDGPCSDTIEIARNASHLATFFRARWPKLPPSRTKYIAEMVHVGGHAIQLPFALRLVTTDVKHAIAKGDVREARLCVARARLIIHLNQRAPWRTLFPGGIAPPLA